VHYWPTWAALPRRSRLTSRVTKVRTFKGECGLQTPHHVSVDTFVADKALFLLTACLDYANKQLHCSQFGMRIKWEAAFISTHRVAEECVGTGKIGSGSTDPLPENRSG
jgi:hypothetical protein